MSKYASGRHNDCTVILYDYVRMTTDEVIENKLEALRAAAENYKAEFERTQGRSLIDRWGIVHALEALNK